MLRLQISQFVLQILVFLLLRLQLNFIRLHVLILSVLAGLNQNRNRKCLLPHFMLKLGQCSRSRLLVSFELVRHPLAVVTNLS